MNQLRIFRTSIVLFLTVFAGPPTPVHAKSLSPLLGRYRVRASAVFAASPSREDLKKFPRSAALKCAKIGKAFTAGSYTRGRFSSALRDKARNVLRTFGDSRLAAVRLKKLARKQNALNRVCKETGYGAKTDQGETDDPLVDSVTYAGEVYYIDCDSGNDSSDGRSPARAWKTTAQARSKTLVGYWDTVAPNEITNPPYHQPWTAAPDGSAFLFKRGCTFDGYLGMHSWRLADSATERGVFAEDFTFGAYGERAKPRPVIQMITLVPPLEHVFWSNNHKVTLRNLRLVANPASGGSAVLLGGADGVLIENCQIENSAWDGITADGSDDLTIRNTTVFNNSNGGGRGGGFAGGGKNLKILQSTFLNNGRDPIGSHNIYARHLTNALIEGNLLVGGSNLGIVIHGSSAQVSIRENDIYGNSNGIMISGYNENDSFDQVLIEKNKIHDNGYRPNEQGYGMLLQSLVNSIVRNNLVYGNRLGSFDLSAGYSGDVPTQNVQVFNNLFQDPTSSYGAGLSGARMKRVSIENNIFFFLSDGRYALTKTTDFPDSELTLNYNLYWMPNKADPRIVLYDERGCSLSDLAAASGKEQNGIMADPGFVAPGEKNFHLTGLSSAIDAGAAVPLNDDFEGHARPAGNGFDIGPYETALYPLVGARSLLRR